MSEPGPQLAGFGTSDRVLPNTASRPPTRFVPFSHHVDDRPLSHHVDDGPRWPEDGGDVTPTGVRAIAATAYVYTYPLVAHYGEMYRQAVDAASSSYSGGFGTWRRMDQTEGAGGGAGATGGRGLRSTAWLDLRSEPWWYTQPAAPRGGSFRSRWIDLWGFVLDERESGADGSEPVSLLASSPSPVWNVPDEIEGVVRGESAFLALCTTVGWGNEDVCPIVTEGLPDVTLEPASVHLGRPAPPPAPANSWWPWKDGIEGTDDFWSCANFALSLTTPHPDDEEVLARLASIGVAPGRPWDPSLLPNGANEAIEAGMDDALNDLLEAALDPAAARVGPCSREAMDRDYFARALSALGRTHSAGRS